MCSPCEVRVGLAVLNAAKAAAPAVNWNAFVLPLNGVPPVPSGPSAPKFTSPLSEPLATTDTPDAPISLPMPYKSPDAPDGSPPSSTVPLEVPEVSCSESSITVTLTSPDNAAVSPSNSTAVIRPDRSSVVAVSGPGPESLIGEGAWSIGLTSVNVQCPLASSVIVNTTWSAVLAVSVPALSVIEVIVSPCEVIPGLAALNAAARTLAVPTVNWNGFVLVPLYATPPTPSGPSAPKFTSPLSEPLAVTTAPLSVTSVPDPNWSPEPVADENVSAPSSTVPLEVPDVSCSESSITVTLTSPDNAAVSPSNSTAVISPDRSSVVAVSVPAPVSGPTGDFAWSIGLTSVNVQSPLASSVIVNTTWSAVLAVSVPALSVIEVIVSPCEVIPGLAALNAAARTLAVPTVNWNGFVLVPLYATPPTPSGPSAPKFTSPLSEPLAVTTAPLSPTSVPDPNWSPEPVADENVSAPSSTVPLEVPEVSCSESSI